MTSHKAEVTSHKSQPKGMVFLLCALGLLTCALCLPAAASAQPASPAAGYSDVQKPGTVSTEAVPQLRDVSFRQRLDEKLPLDAAFKDEHGQAVTLGQYFTGDKPVVLAFVYYSCPMLCMQVMNGLSSVLKATPFTAGKDFDVVLISFDARDTPATALEKERAHLAYWSREEDAASWHLLTGDEVTIRRVTSAAGFTYQWDERTGQFAHVSGVLVATPEGRLSRYFYGVEYSPKEMRLALVESGEGKIGSAIDELLLYCFHYDPESGRYGLLVMNLVRAGGVLTMLFIGGFIFLMRRRDAHGPLEGRA